MTTHINHMAFDKVLIANRGEIAIRIIKACKQLDLATVVVFSDADRDALYVTLADQAVHIGAAEATNSYLRIDKIIEAATKTGAGAIHPGYGFLAENADFARECEKRGIAFIGPKASIIEQMGSKIQSKALAIKSNVPVIPGYHGEDQSLRCLESAAEEIGVPLMIKASAGGGGRGMRLVTDLTFFGQELELAQKEALSAFGDPAVLLERYVRHGRHVEVQILGDKAGKGVHLFDRDCSVQRKHQKIIEEAPAPNIPAAIKEKMFEAALSLSTDIGYDSAGTVEFMYDAGREEFYFLEMNTRLQVEHPVTEAITGIDLVQWQIRIALGEELSFNQQDISCNGWAIEARIAAENPADNYMPETGVVDDYNEPSGRNIRIDSGITQGSEVSHYYDSMLAKVIVSADSRSAAIRRLKRAIGSYAIGGIQTNSTFLLDVLNLEAFVAGNHHTGLLEQSFPGGWAKPETSQVHIAEAFLAAYLNMLDLKSSDPWSRLGAWRVTELSGRPASAYFTGIVKNQNSLSVRIQGSAGIFHVHLDDKIILHAVNATFKAGKLEYEVEGLRSSMWVKCKGNSASLQTPTCFVTVELLKPEHVFLSKKENRFGGDNQIIAPMPGLIVDILTSKGQRVKTGETLLILEAMKLMQKLVSPVTGTVADIHFGVGDTPEKGAVLISIDPDIKTKEEG